MSADFGATPFKTEIANTEQQRVQAMLVIGGCDMEAGTVSVRLHHGGPTKTQSKGKLIANVLALARKKRS